MKNSVSQFLGILADNDFKPKYRDIPDEVDNRDEIIADIQETLDDDGLLPASLTFYELNGKSNKDELKEYLEKSFQQFKNEFLAGNHGDNDLFNSELLQQLDEIMINIEQEIYGAKQLDDNSLSQMLVAKTSICDEVSEFIKRYQGTNQTSTPEKEPVERLSFKWLKEEKLLQDFYVKMKANQLIAADTDINDFKAIFSNVPVSDIKKLVQWERGAKLFAYFFRKLMNKKYIPQRPSWVNLKYCFTSYSGVIGKYEPITEGVKAHVTVISKEGAPKGYELVDVLFPNS